MKRNFANWIEAFEDYASQMQVHRSFVQWSAISVIAGALERKVWISINGKLLFPNMFIILESPAGIGRKTTTSGMAVDLLRQVGDVQFTSQVGTQASLIEQILEAGAKRKVTFDGKEHAMSAIYAYAPEAVMLLKESFGSITELFTDWYDCYPGYWSMENPWRKSTKGDGNIDIYNLCLNSLLCTTPEYLQKFMSKQDANGGFASRCLFIYEEDLPEREFDWQDDAGSNLHNQALKGKLVEDLREIHAMQGVWKISPEAKSVYVQIKRKLDKWLVQNKNNPIKTFKARKDITILKLAQVLAAAKSSEMRLGVADIELAMAWYEKAEESMHKVFQGLYDDPNAALLRDIFQFIKNSGANGVFMKDILSAFLAKSPGKDTIGRIVQGLVSSEAVRIQKRAEERLPRVIANRESI